VVAIGQEVDKRQAQRGIEYRELERRARVRRSAGLEPGSLRRWLLHEHFATEFEGELYPAPRAVEIDWAKVLEFIQT